MDITFEFLGGPFDGKVTSGMLGDAAEAEHFYRRTSHGTPGFIFKIGSECATAVVGARAGGTGTRPHFYVVDERSQFGREVYIRVRHVAPGT